LLVLTKKFNKKIIDADYQTKSLQGGTIGDVQLVSGVAKNDNGEKLPYKVVWKVQRNRAIPGETKWGRDYDLFMSDFGKIFTDTLRWPEFYHAEIINDETHIWTEYIEGISGYDLTTEMLEKISEEFGRFQGSLYKNPEILKNINCLNIGEYIKRDYGQWNQETVEYQYIRSDNCEIPKYLTQMLINMDNNFEKIYENIKKLPVVLCHRDFWIENIFYSNGTIILIDWDYASWGYLGEDIASLIEDDIIDMKYISEYYQKFIPAYYKGISEYVDISTINDDYIWEMMIIKFGYRFIHRYIYADTTERKNQQIIALQQLYEIKN
jgi:thiamine kinase-like enzyme